MLSLDRGWYFGKLVQATGGHLLLMPQHKRLQLGIIAYLMPAVLVLTHVSLTRAAMERTVALRVVV